MVLVSHLILQNHWAQKHYGREPLKVSDHCANFDSHRNCVNVDEMKLVCHKISLDHILKASYGLIGRSSSR